MIKKRIIPVVLLKNGQIVQSRLFKRHQVIGSPTAVVERLSNWSSDELIYIDISQHQLYDLSRDDLNQQSFSSIQEIIQQVAFKCHMPLSFGGGIRKIEDIDMRISSGADKVTINSLLYDKPNVVKEGVRKYGSQAIVASIDVKRDESGNFIVFKGGKHPLSVQLQDFVTQIVDLGVGEILLNAIHKDGTASGFDIELINIVVDLVSIPVIALGGAGNWEHFSEVLEKSNASAVAAANIFQHSENSYYKCKEYLAQQSLPVRFSSKLSNQSKNL